MNQLQKIGASISSSSIGKTVKNFFEWSPVVKKYNDLKSYLTRTNLPRFRIDLQLWKEAIEEAERQILPFRVKMTRVYNQTKLNDHVTAVMEKRMDLTLLKGFEFVDKNGKEIEDVTALFKDKTWFDELMKYALEAVFDGFSLIQIHDVINGEVSKVSIIRRRNISPDRETLSPVEYMPGGVKFNDPEFPEIMGSCIWVTTPSDIGESNVGYGLLYKIALLEIFLRNNITFNANFVELFSQPIRWAKTSKTDGVERDNLESAMQGMGNSAYIITDTMDEISLLESNLGGTGYKGYESFQTRLENGITKIALGHSSALDAVPGKLGSNDDIIRSLDDKEKKDTKFITSVINDQVLPKLRVLGVKIPEGVRFQFKNDKEKALARASENEANLADATVFKTIKDAGGEPDWNYFTERTGIKTTKAEVPEVAPMQTGKAIPEKVKNEIDKIYL